MLKETATPKEGRDARNSVSFRDFGYKHPLVEPHAAECINVRIIGG